MKKKDDLTTRQKDILTFIKKYIARNGYSPSIREIGAHVNLNSPATVHTHIQNLIELGYLKREENSHKTLELLVPNEFEIRAQDAVKVPYFDTFVIKDFNHDFEHPDSYFYLSSQMVPKGVSVFVMNIQDDSMCNIGIYENDKVIVECVDQFSNRDIVAAIVEDSLLVIRTYYYEDGYIRLQPENDILPPTVLKDVTILGRVSGIYRKY